MDKKNSILLRLEGVEKETKKSLRDVLQNVIRLEALYSKEKINFVETSQAVN